VSSLIYRYIALITHTSLLQFVVADVIVVAVVSCLFVVAVACLFVVAVACLLLSS